MSGDIVQQIRCIHAAQMLDNHQAHFGKKPGKYIAMIIRRCKDAIVRFSINDLNWVVASMGDRERPNGQRRVASAPCGAR